MNAILGHRSDFCRQSATVGGVRLCVVRQEDCMKSLLLAASVFAVVSATMPSARAADLGYDRSPADNYSSPYDDPRYRDLYSAPPPRYAERYEYRERTYREPVPGYA